jgi:hypothetical protein
MKKIIFEKIGSVSINLGKLAFASLVLGSILKADFESVNILIVGSATTLMLVSIGIFLTAKNR